MGLHDGRPDHRRGLRTPLTAILLTQAFDAFTPDNDPYGEHDFGSFKLEGVLVYWKIDYYDLTLKTGSDNPADEAVTARILTIFLASEY